MNHNGQNSAYPSTESEFNQSANGLTKRELLAAMAMQGLLASGRILCKDLAESAVKGADDLLAALELTA